MTKGKDRDSAPPPQPGVGKYVVDRTPMAKLDRTSLSPPRSSMPPQPASRGSAPAPPGTKMISERISVPAPAAAPMATSGKGTLTPKAQELARSFLSALFMAVRTAQIHDPGNRAFDRSVLALRDSADALFAATGGFAVQFVEESVFVNGFRLRFVGSGYDAIRTLKHMLESRELGGINVQQPPAEAAMRRLVLLFARGIEPGAWKAAKDELGAHLGLMGVQRLADGDAGGIKVDRRVFALHCYAKLVLAYRELAKTAALHPATRTPPRLRSVRIVQDLVELCGERPDFVLRLGMNHSGASPDELHAANVCVLSLALGHALGLERQDLVDLSIGALFHDLGRSPCTSAPVSIDAPRASDSEKPISSSSPQDLESRSEATEDVEQVVGYVIDGRYEVLQVIGRGGMGTIYRARQTSTGRDVALKLLHTSFATNREVAHRFDTEARVIAQLRHPNTLKLIDSGKLPDGRLYIITELLEGKPLDVVLKKGPLGALRTVRILKHVCDSLAEAHLRGVVHRDLKPGNIFLEQVGEQEIVKVLDFGIAQVVSNPSLTGPMQVCGSPAYMSPEQAQGAATDGRSDLYSLGVVAYECLSGCLPLVAETPMKMVLKQINEEPVPLTELTDLDVPEPIDPELAGVVMLLLAKDPEQRFQNASELRKWLDRIERRLVLHAAPVQAAEAPAAPAPRLPVTDRGEVVTPPRHPEERFDFASPSHVHATFARLLDASGIGRSGIVRSIVGAEHHIMAGERHLWGEARSAGHLFSRIVAIADAFDSMTSGIGTDTGTAVDPLDALGILVRDRSGRVDSRLVDLLINVLRAFPSGVEVLLETGERAIVRTHLGGSRWDRPIVLVESRDGGPPSQLDLMVKDGSRFLNRIVGTGRFFSRRSLPPPAP